MAPKATHTHTHTHTHTYICCELKVFYDKHANYFTIFPRILPPIHALALLHILRSYISQLLVIYSKSFPSSPPQFLTTMSPVFNFHKKHAASCRLFLPYHRVRSKCPLQSRKREINLFLCSINSRSRLRMDILMHVVKHS